MSQHVITINFVIDTDVEHANAQEQEAHLRGIGQNIIGSIPEHCFKKAEGFWEGYLLIVDTKVLGVA